MISDRRVIDFIRRRSVNESKILQDIEDYAKKNHVPIIEKESAFFLRQLVMLKKPEYILEIGAAIGYSSILMSMSFNDCKVDTIEKSPDMVHLALENIEKANLESQIRVYKGNAEDVLASDNLRGGYDLIFIDAAKGQYSKFFELAIKLASSDPLVVCDNIFIGGQTLDYENTPKRNKTMVRKMIAFIDEINSNPHFELSLIPIGDGIALIQRKTNGMEKDDE